MRARSFVATMVAVLLVAAVPAAAGAASGRTQAPYQVKLLRVISGPTPFEGTPPDVAGYEGETTITMNPLHPGNLIASWMQDIGGAVGARTNLVAASQDNGRTWARTQIPGLTRFNGGTADGAADPWLAAGADGTVYYVGGSLAVSGNNSIVSSRSTNGGDTWIPPVIVAAADPQNDKPSVTADPVVPGRAYAIWAHWDRQLVVPLTSALKLARTNDRGSTWSDEVIIDSPPSNAVDLSSAILVMPGREARTLLAVYERIQVAADGSATEKFFSRRSPDRGATWRPEVEIASMPIGPLADPETGEALPQPGFLSAAAGPDGSAYVVWERQDSPTSAAIDVARTRDFGRSWRVSPLPGVTAFAFEPSVAVDAHGTVGVTWYDLRNDKPGDGSLTADVWFAWSSDRASSWRQAHVAGPTDLRTASHIPNNRVGEYQGLTALRGRGFGAVFTLAAPQAQDGQTDVFFARIGPGHGR